MQRLNSADLVGLLSEMGLGTKGGDGQTTLISLEAIPARIGARWNRKQEQVEAFVERVFDRISKPGDLIVTISDTDFVIVQPGVSRLAALNTSALILKEALTFFLGRISGSDLRVAVVTGIADGKISTEEVDATHLGSEATSSPPDESPRLFPTSFQPEILAVPRIPAQTLVSSTGRLEAMFLAEAIWHISPQVVTSFAIEPLAFTPNEYGALTPCCSTCLPPSLGAELTLGVIEFAKALFARGLAAGERFALHIPLPLNVLTVSQSRYPILKALREIDPAARALLILELTDLPSGLPQSRMVETVSMVKGLGRAVLARVATLDIDLGPWRRCGLNGVALDGYELQRSDTTVAKRLADFVQQAHLVAEAVVCHRLSSRSLILAAWAAGFTHVSGSALTEEVGGVRGALRVHASDLYRECRA